MAAFWGQIWQGGGGADNAPLSAAKHACDELAKACDHFAHAIDQAHSDTEHKLAGAGIAIGFTTALGVVLTPFTGGGSDAGAAALDTAEAGAILGDVAVTLDASVTAISTDMIADTEVYLQAAAEGVPEVEAVDAETTAVDQTLERELAETEARTPAGTGGRGGFGRGGGGKPPTGGGEEPPPPEGEGDLPNLSTSDRRALRSLRKRLSEHEEKFERYIKDPDAADHKGILKNKPPEIRQRIIQGRVNHLQNEIREFRRQINDITGGS